MQIYVVRHTPVAIADGLCYGRTEVDLKPDYLSDFKTLKHKLPKGVDAVISSPSQRCQKLAAYLHPPYTTDSALCELDFGTWENKLWQDLPTEETQPWFDNYVSRPTPQGESLLQLFLRISKFMDDLRRKNYRRVILVTHAGVIRAMMAYFLEFPLNNLFKLQVDFNRVYTCNLADKAEHDWVEW